MAIIPYNWVILLANGLIPVAILIFSSGFFPYKSLLPGLATFEEADSSTIPPPVFDKVVFMVVDALRSDFVFANDSGFLFTQSLIRSGAALPFTAHASSPTVTMPRLKAMTTGSVPSFLDVILNIAESDTTSTLAYQDTWLAQLKVKGGRLVMYGDDTWLKLFPETFDRTDGTTSFYVSDFTEVDNNVTRHVTDELSHSDWTAFIMHYLGLDHIGHKVGPRGPYMIAKQQEMDSVVNEIYASMEQEAHLQSTLLVLCGDHGMSDAGNHGGSSTGETSPALLFVSPKFQGKGAYRDSPVDAFNTMQYYRTVEQADITPTLSGLLGMPIPLNNLGVFIPEFLMMWEHNSHRFHILLENCKQLLKTVKATFPGYDFELGSIPSDCDSGTRSGVEGIQCAWLRVLGLLESKNAVDLGPETESALLHFSRTAQNVMSSTSSNYDVTRLNLGLYIGGFAVLITLSATYKLISRFRHAGAFLILNILGYGAMMFASSYVEEEQQFWYWIITGWTFYLHVRSFVPVRGSSSSHPLAPSIARNVGSVGLAITHRIIRRWNQTGQKFSAEPDIARGFFPSRPNLLWLLIILTYADTCRYLLISMPASIVWWSTAVAVTMAAFMFKLNFVASDSPELLSSSPLRPFGNESIPLVSQARLAFCGIALLMVLPIFIQRTPRSSDRRKGKSSYRAIFHEALTLLLMTQSRAANIPLFLIFRIQLYILDLMGLTGIEVTITSLLSQHMAFFAFGGSNSIASVDLSSAYNGIGSYSVVLVGILTYISNWAGPIWWVSAARQLRRRATRAERLEHITLLTFHAAASVVSVMAACTVLRSHLFIWTVFSPKYLYMMAWVVFNHIGVNILTEADFLPLM
ncbi:hypothetical protein PHISP_05933 [Aspergillus sp. HF37]|nr:hypothetical protein PHISP_05933 [Aspergillus sp. HF37]